MIELIDLYAKNFRSIGNNGIKIELNKLGNLSLVFSEQNGSGKTTMFVQALIYALKGKAYNEKAKLANLVNLKNKKDCLVELNYISNGKNYLIRRGLKPSIFQLFENGDEVDNGTKLQDTIDKTIDNMSFNMLVNSLILSNSRYTPFRQLTKMQREEFVDTLMGTYIINPMMSKISSSVKQSAMRIEDHERELNYVDQTLKLKHANLAKMRTFESDTLSTLTDGHASLTSSIADLESKLTSIDKEWRSLSEVYTDKNTYYSKQNTLLTATLNKVDSDLLNLNKHISSLNSNECPLCKSSFSDETILNGLHDKFESLTKTKTAIVDKKTSLLPLYTELVELQTSINELAAIMTSTKTEIQVKTNQIASIEAMIKQSKLDTTPILHDIEESIQHRDSIICLLESVQSNHNNHNDALQFLKNQDFRKQIFTEQLIYINHLLNEYLSGMEFFITIELKSDYSIEVISSAKKGLLLQDLSDGERSKIDLAFILVWKTLSLQMYNADVGLFVLDETLANFSPQSVIEFLTLVKKVLPNHKIIVILQHPNDFIEIFDNIIEFEMKNDFTVLKSN
jgi:DNA repair exonuclease SbcCD ATPase subunit